MAAFAAFAFALAATGAGAADISFVEGRLDAKEVKGSGECSRMTLESFDARGDVISGSWIHPYALGNIDIAIKGNAIDADFSGMWIDSATATTERVGRDLHVMFDVSVEGEGPCEVAFVLPGVIADAPTTVAVSPSPSPTLSQTSEAQQVAPLLPQASPIQLAAAPGNKFDGEWEGTTIGEEDCTGGNFPLEATVRDNVFSTVITAQRSSLEPIRKKMEGSVGENGELSFWSGKIKILGKFSSDGFQGIFIRTGTCQRL